MADGVAASPSSESPLPPFDTHAERSVLGAILLDDVVLADVRVLVAPRDFFNAAHAFIFASMLALADRHEPIDIVTLAAELASHQHLASIGGASYLGELTDTIPTIAHIEQHARIVADLAQVRRMISAAHEIAMRCYADRGEPAQLASWAERTFLAASERQARTEPRPLGDFVIESFERLEQATQSGGVRVTGLATGFDGLDEITQGLHPGHLVVLAGRPGTGKSGLALNIADHAASLGAPVLFFSQEMPGREYADRQLASHSGVGGDVIRGLNPTSDELAQLAESANAIFQRPIWLDDACRLTVTEITAKARRAKQRHDVKLIVIDHLGLMDHERSREERGDEAIGRTTSTLKALAKDLGVPVLLLSQLNRECEKRTDKRPELADLRGSGDIEADADLVWFLYRDELYNRDSDDRGIAELCVAKQRGGRVGVVRLRFRGAVTRFENIPADDAASMPPERKQRRSRTMKPYEPRE